MNIAANQFSVHDIPESHTLACFLDFKNVILSWKVSVPVCDFF